MGKRSGPPANWRQIAKEFVLSRAYPYYGEKQTGIINGLTAGMNAIERKLYEAGISHEQSGRLCEQLAELCIVLGKESDSAFKVECMKILGKMTDLQLHEALRDGINALAQEAGLAMYISSGVTKKKGGLEGHRPRETTSSRRER